jgi:hypothetical protein
MSFAITVLPAVAGHRRVCVEGRVDASAVADVRAMVRSALTMPTRHLTIDVREAVIDDVGRACLDEVISHASGLGVEVRLVQAAAPAPDDEPAA